MTDSARTEEIRARVEKVIDRHIPPHNAIDAEREEGHYHCEECADAIRARAIDAAIEYADTELTALREEVERLRGALRAATRCPTCEGTGKMTLECMACLSGEPGARCTCAEETCAQCDGRGWATADGTGEELVAAALSPSPAQQEHVPKRD
jgi:hypothetical protein